MFASALQLVYFFNATPQLDKIGTFISEHNLKDDEDLFYRLVNSLFTQQAFIVCDGFLSKNSAYGETSLQNFVFDLQNRSIIKIPATFYTPQEHCRVARYADISGKVNNYPYKTVFDSHTNCYLPVILSQSMMANLRNIRGKIYQAPKGATYSLQQLYLIKNTLKYQKNHTSNIFYQLIHSQAYEQLWNVKTPKYKPEYIVKSSGYFDQYYHPLADENTEYTTNTSLLMPKLDNQSLTVFDATLMELLMHCSL